MSTETYAQRLVKVRETIDKILSGSQSWRFGDRQYTRADLGRLWEMEKQYARLAAKEDAAAKGAGRNRVRYVRY